MLSRHEATILFIIFDRLGKIKKFCLKYICKFHNQMYHNMSKQKEATFQQNILGSSFAFGNFSVHFFQSMYLSNQEPNSF